MTGEKQVLVVGIEAKADDAELSDSLHDETKHCVQAKLLLLAQVHFRSHRLFGHGSRDEIHEAEFWCQQLHDTAFLEHLQRRACFEGQMRVDQDRTDP